MCVGKYDEVTYCRFVHTIVDAASYHGMAFVGYFVMIFIFFNVYSLVRNFFLCIHILFVQLRIAKVKTSLLGPIDSTYWTLR